MKKATSDDFLELLNNFKLKNNIQDERFDYYAIFKFYKSTLLNEFYDMTLAKTSLEKTPIMIQYSNNSVLAKDSYSGLLTKQENTPDYVPVLKDEYVEPLTKFLDILETSNGFKELVTRSHETFGDELTSTNFSKGVDIIKTINYMASLNDAVHRNESNETSLSYYIDGIISEIPRNNLRKYTILSHFRGHCNDDLDELMDKFYTEFDTKFDDFKAEQSLVIGRLLFVETENQTLDKPLLNQFIAELKAVRPEWFLGFDEALHHAVIDDNQIRAAGLTLGSMTADFDIIDPNTFMATASPSSYVDGYDHMSRRYLSSENNSVHVYGDNPFFKVYYHNLLIEKENNLTLCKDIESDVAFCIKDSDNRNYTYPVLDYLEKNNVILNLSQSCRFLHYIKKDDLINEIGTKYPNLIILHDDMPYKKKAYILSANNFEEALDIYKNDNQQVVEKPTNLKIKPFKL